MHPQVGCVQLGDHTKDHRIPAAHSQKLERGALPCHNLPMMIFLARELAHFRKIALGHMFYIVLVLSKKKLVFPQFWAEDSSFQMFPAVRCFENVWILKKSEQCGDDLSTRV